MHRTDFESDESVATSIREVAAPNFTTVSDEERRSILRGNEPATSGKKTCSGCGRTLPVIHFGAWEHSEDGLWDFCRQCERNCPD